MLAAVIASGRRVASGITFVASSNFNGRTNASTGAWSASAPAGIAAGDVVLCCISYDRASPAPVLPTGFTQIQETNVGTPDAQAIMVGYKVATGSETTFSATAGTNVSMTAVFALFRGCAASPINASSVTSNGSSNASPITVAAPAIATTVANCLHVIVTTVDCGSAGTIGHTTPSGYTKLVELSNTSGNFSDIYVASKVIATAASTGTVNVTTTTPAPAGWLAVSVALAPP
jgi:hypothetical protein